jgi:hypothetical protein
MPGPFRARSARSLTAFVIALAALIAAASPISAATPNYSPTARCLYSDVSVPGDGWVWLMQIRRIEVKPPKVFAAQPGKQLVGWRFAVERQIEQEGWKVTYRSPIQSAKATPTRPAAFQLMGVNVKIPQRVFDDVLFLDYRVVITTFWYNADGSKQSSLVSSPGTYRDYMDGQFMFTFDSCYFSIGDLPGDN